MQFELVVISPFGSYQRGDRITDPTVVASILKSPNEHQVVRVPVTPATKAEG